MRTVARSCKVKEGSAQATNTKEQILLGKLESTQFEVAKGTQGLGKAMSILNELDGAPRSRSKTRSSRLGPCNIGVLACWSERSKKEASCVVQ